MPGGNVARTADRRRVEVRIAEATTASADAAKADAGAKGRRGTRCRPIARLVNEVGDDRDSVEPGDDVLLIVENDLAFARFLLETAREQGFKGIVTSQGVAALELAGQFKPSAITLDLFLPDIDGWRVLHRLKNDAATRHIPGRGHFHRRIPRAGAAIPARTRSSPSRSRARKCSRRCCAT